MSKQFEQLLEICTTPLKDDPERKLDVKAELRTHLEDEYEELKSIEPDDEKRAELCKAHFGDPEEISQGLLMANLSRLKFRAKVRFALKLIFIPVLLIALYFCIDWRSLFGIYLFVYVMQGSDSENGKTIISAERKFFAKMTKEEKFIVFGDGDYFNKSLDSQHELITKYPEQPIFVANYISQLLIKAAAAPSEYSIKKLEAELNKAEVLDPGNAFYNYALADVYLKKSIEMQSKKNPETRILDRQMLDNAMLEVKKGNAKPYCKTYEMEMLDTRFKILDFPHNFLGTMERIYFSCELHLSIPERIRNVSFVMPFYGNLLLSEGNEKEAEFYFDAWKPFVFHHLQDSNILYNVLLCNTALSYQNGAAELRKDSKRVQELKPILEIFETWRKQKDTAEGVIKNHSGLLGGSLLSVLKENITADDLEPDRTLSYVLADTVVLASQGAFLFAVICLYAICVGILYLFGKRGFLITLPIKTYGRIFLYGFVIPFLVYMVFTRIDCLSGRGFSIGYNITRPIIGGMMLAEVFLFIGIPCTYMWFFGRELKKRGKELGFAKLPVATFCINMMFAWAFLLLCAGCFIRPIFSYEQKQAIKRDTLIYNAKYLSKIEEKVTARLRSEMLQKIKGTMQGK